MNATEETLYTLAHPRSAPVTYVLPNGGVLPVVGGAATDPQTTAIAIPPWATDCTVFATYTPGVASTTPGYTLAFFLGYGTSTTLMSADRADGNGPIGASAGPNSAPLFSRAVVLRDIISGAARLGISAIDQDGTHPGTLTISVVFHRS